MRTRRCGQRGLRRVEKKEEPADSEFGKHEGDVMTDPAETGDEDNPRRVMGQFELVALILGPRFVGLHHRPADIKPAPKGRTYDQSRQVARRKKELAKGPSTYDAAANRVRASGRSRAAGWHELVL